MILNHNDNHALFLHTIDHGEYKPLMDAYGELLTTINHLAIDGETRSKLFELATNAVERAEDNAFDKAAELQAAITTDELTDRKEDDEMLSTPANDNGQSDPSVMELTNAVREYIQQMSRKDMKDFGHDPINGGDQMLAALHTIDQLAAYDEGEARAAYFDFLENNLCGMSFEIKD